jgi:hypothetical protein
MAYVNRLSGTHAARPAANLAFNTRYYETDTGKVFQSSGATWVQVYVCEGNIANAFLSGNLSARPTASSCVGAVYTDENNVTYEAFPGGWATISLGQTSQPIAVGALTPGTTVALAPSPLQNAFTLTPAQSCTINATVSNCVAGRFYALEIVTSGTSSFTITFGSNMKSTGTLATGTTSAKTFMVLFFFDGTNLVEVSRTTAQ